MSFYLDDPNWFQGEGFALMLKTIADVCPAALSTRYGAYEPLQGRVGNGDTAALAAAFAEDPDIFMRARTPFSWVFMSVPSDVQIAKWHLRHFLRQEYLATRICFELRPKAFDDPAVPRLFHALSDGLGVLYSEIRRDRCPVSAWFWRGLPPGPVDAFCLGGRYPEIWPEAARQAVTLPGGTLAIGRTRLGHALPDPPADLRDPLRPFEPGSRDPARYAPVFPFVRPGDT